MTPFAWQKIMLDKTQQAIAGTSTPLLSRRSSIEVVEFQDLEILKCLALMKDKKKTTAPTKFNI